VSALASGASAILIDDCFHYVSVQPLFCEITSDITFRSC
jgi:hypothetical protein